MKIAVFGATGKVGREVAEAALTRGHEVRACVRTPEKLGPLATRLEVLQGVVTEEAWVARCIDGVDAVVSAVGYQPRVPKGFMAPFARHLVAHTPPDVPVVTLLGALIAAPGEARPAGWQRAMRWAAWRVARVILEDLHAHAEILREGDVDHVLVRPPRLTMGPRTGRVEAHQAPMPFGASLSRKDLADFMLDQIDPALRLVPDAIPYVP